MTEMGNVKSFQAYVNQIYPGGSLFLILNDKEFKQLFMEEANNFLQSNSSNCTTPHVEWYW